MCASASAHAASVRQRAARSHLLQDGAEGWPVVLLTRLHPGSVAGRAELSLALRHLRGDAGGAAVVLVRAPHVGSVELAGALAQRGRVRLGTAARSDELTQLGRGLASVHHAGERRHLLAAQLLRARRHHARLVPVQQSLDPAQRGDLLELGLQAGVRLGGRRRRHGRRAAPLARRGSGPRSRAHECPPRGGRAGHPPAAARAPRTRCGGPATPSLSRALTRARCDAADAPSGRVARPRAAPVRASLGFGNRVKLRSRPTRRGARRADGRAGGCACGRACVSGGASCAPILALRGPGRGGVG